MKDIFSFETGFVFLWRKNNIDKINPYKYHGVVNSFIEYDTNLTQSPTFLLANGKQEGGGWFYVPSISMKLSTPSGWLFETIISSSSHNKRKNHIKRYHMLNQKKHYLLPLFGRGSG
jgi:hypothetical protein